MFALVIIFHWEPPGIWHLDLQRGVRVASARQGPVCSKPWTCPSRLSLTATIREAATIKRPAFRAVKLPSGYHIPEGEKCVCGRSPALGIQGLREGGMGGFIDEFAGDLGQPGISGAVADILV